MAAQASRRSLSHVVSMREAAWMATICRRSGPTARNACAVSGATTTTSPATASTGRPPTSNRTRPAWTTNVSEYGWRCRAGPSPRQASTTKNETSEPYGAPSKRPALSPAAARHDEREAPPPSIPAFLFQATFSSYSARPLADFRQRSSSIRKSDSRPGRRGCGRTKEAASCPAPSGRRPGETAPVRATCVTLLSRGTSGGRPTRCRAAVFA